MQFYGLTKAEAKLLIELLREIDIYNLSYTSEEVQTARELKYYLENGHRRGE